MYYHNAATKESKWTIPEELDAARKQAASLEAAAAPAVSAAPTTAVAPPAAVAGMGQMMPMMGKSHGI